MRKLQDLSDLIAHRLGIRDSEMLENRKSLFERRLTTVRNRNGTLPFRWYPYSTLSNVSFLDQLQAQSGLNILRLSGGHPILDIGCGDGDLSFFLEHLGLQVDALDYEETNFNRMQGAKYLHKMLDSGIQLKSCDLDSQFQLPRRSYGLGLCLGLLYHLKNPIYVLEQLARSCQYAIVSTRIASHFSDSVSVQDLPVAYILNADELNGDPSNFWIFSKTALARIFERCGFNVIATVSNRPSQQSLPSGTKDERLFCLLQSRHPVFSFDGIQLDSGWHELEDGRRRWTMKNFRISAPGLPFEPDLVRLNFYLPDEITGHLPVEISSRVGCELLSASSYSRCGRHTYEAAVPKVLQGGDLAFDFHISHSLDAGTLDDRELGICVDGVDLA